MRRWQGDRRQVGSDLHQKQADATSPCAQTLPQLFQDDTPAMKADGGASPFQSSGQALRGSRTSAAEVIAFEQECTQIESMLQLQQLRHADNRRSHNRHPKPHNSSVPLQHTQQRHSTPGATDMKPACSSDVDALLAHAMHLRDTLAELVQLVPDDADSQSDGHAVAAHRPGNATVTGCKQGSTGSVRMPLRAVQLTDTVELASIRAVARMAAPGPAYDQHVSSADAAACSQEEAQCKPAQASPVQGGSNADATSNHAAPAPPKQRDSMGCSDSAELPQVQVPVPQQAGPARCGSSGSAADAQAVLAVQAVEAMPVPAASLAAMHNGMDPCVWIAWRMPGALERTAWCKLAALAQQEMVHHPGRGFCVPSMALQSTSKVRTMLPQHLCLRGWHCSHVNWHAEPHVKQPRRSSLLKCREKHATLTTTCAGGSQPKGSAEPASAWTGRLCAL